MHGAEIAFCISFRATNTWRDTVNVIQPEYLCRSGIDEAAEVAHGVATTVPTMPIVIWRVADLSRDQPHLRGRNLTLMCFQILSNTGRVRNLLDIPRAYQESRLCTRTSTPELFPVLSIVISENLYACCPSKVNFKRISDILKCTFVSSTDQVGGHADSSVRPVTSTRELRLTFSLLSRLIYLSMSLPSKSAQITPTINIPQLRTRETHFDQSPQKRSLLNQPPSIQKPVLRPLLLFTDPHIPQP